VGEEWRMERNGGARGMKEWERNGTVGEEWRSWKGMEGVGEESGVGEERRSKRKRMEERDRNGEERRSGRGMEGVGEECRSRRGMKE
jgi:hypothetical protein